MAILQDGQLLLVRQTYRGETLWTFPGGGIMLDETAAGAAVREVKEETNLDTQIVRLLYTGPRTRGSGMYYCYQGEIIGGVLQLGTDPELPRYAQELHEVRWWQIEWLTEHPEVSLILPALCQQKGPANG
ncbi:MAG TPA: NUDIX hydrolase [Caldilineaceae bacterium]|nr:NUDIX hydrolase [Caldilineaceae bacterium]